eukprot:TRINITY_DN1731_c0_g1_i1.p1 TRINITY_DN1731_c0_g1~~TRINITY_DN1731_c0_g1_i1.p1  ORF type:complete len:209 (-),score=17.46 TRINITY_DN1731_c0_g1_i1:152-778(-)
MPPNNNNTVILNIYDLHPYNKYVNFLGMGVYHSAIEVYGTEYSFGGHNYSITGIFTVEPKCALGATYRESITLGETSLTRREVDQVIEKMSEDWLGNSYTTLTRNCNTFSNEFVKVLLNGKTIPGYVNRLANIGTYFSCLLPPILLSTPSSTDPTGIQESNTQSSAQAPLLSQSSPPLLSQSSSPPLFPGSGHLLRESLETRLFLPLI